MHPGPLRRIILAVVATVVLATACGSDGEATTTAASVDTTTPDTTPPTTGAPATTAAPASTAPPTTADPYDHRFRVVFADGAVEGGPPRLEVDVGDRVLLTVTSDITDHVHVHGPDVFVDIAAGVATEVEFEAAPPGQWEIELEDSGHRLADLVIG